MTTTTTTENDENGQRHVDKSVRRALLHELPLELRRLHVATLAETLANGVPIDPGALVVVLSAHDDAAQAPLHFTTAHVEQLIWFGIAEFCEDFGLTMPSGCVAALHAALAVACGHDSLDDQSDDTRLLFSALTQLAAG